MFLYEPLFGLRANRREPGERKLAVYLAHGFANGGDHRARGACSAYGKSHLSHAAWVLYRRKEDYRRDLLPLLAVFRVADYADDFNQTIRAVGRNILRIGITAKEDMGSDGVSIGEESARKSMIDDGDLGRASIILLGQIASP